MHIPDGYISPMTVATSYAVMIPLWAYGFKKLKEKLDEKTLPLLGTLSALSFLIYIKYNDCNKYSSFLPLFNVILM
jgi:cobalt/nickel transport system permease protein